MAEWPSSSPQRSGQRLEAPAAVIEAAAQGSSPDRYSMVSYYRPELSGLPGEWALSDANSGTSRV